MLSCFTQLYSADCFLKTFEMHKANDMEKRVAVICDVFNGGESALLAFDFTSGTLAFATLEGWDHFAAHIFGRG